METFGHRNFKNSLYWIHSKRKRPLIVNVTESKEVSVYSKDTLMRTRRKEWKRRTEKWKREYVYENGVHTVVTPEWVNKIHGEIFKEITKEDYSDFLIKYNDVDKIFIGRDSDWKGNIQGFTDKGNTILLKLKTAKNIMNKYVFISKIIYELKIDDEIIEYYSIISEGDDPRPIAVGKANVYHLNDYRYIKREEFENKFKQDLDYSNCETLCATQCTTVAIYLIWSNL